MRDVRYRFIGILSFIVFALMMLLSKYSLPPAQVTPNVDLLRDPVTFAVFGLLLTIFASEGIGYIFSTVAIFIWEKYTGGYSGILKKELGDEERIIEKLEGDRKRIFQNCRDIDYDLFISYFWQRADRSLLDWAVRRWNIYFTNLSAIFTIVMTFIISFILINHNFFNIFKSIQFEYSNNIILLMFGLILYSSILYSEANRNKMQAINMIKLWLKDSNNSKPQTVIKNYSS